MIRTTIDEDTRRPFGKTQRSAQLLFRLSGLVSCETVNEKYDDKRRYFPVAAVRIGQFKGSGSTKRLSGHNVGQLLALWRVRLLACLRHGRLDKAHGV
jgi:hypothetical protein